MSSLALDENQCFTYGIYAGVDIETVMLSNPVYVGEQVRLDRISLTQQQLRRLKTYKSLVV